MYPMPVVKPAPSNPDSGPKGNEVTEKLREARMGNGLREVRMGSPRFEEEHLRSEVSSEHEVEIWEGAVTFALFPILVVRSALAASVCQAARGSASNREDGTKYKPCGVLFFCRPSLPLAAALASRPLFSRSSRTASTLACSSRRV